MFSKEKKFLAYILVAVIVISQMLTANALAAADKPTVYLYHKTDIGVNTGGFDGNFEVISDYLNLSGLWLKTLGNCVYTVADDGLIGYTEVKFEFVADSDENKQISFDFLDWSEDKTEKSLFDISAVLNNSNSYDISFGGKAFAQLKKGERAGVTLDINTAAGKVGICISDSVGREFSEEVYIDMKKMSFSKMKFSGKDMYISDIAMYRKKTIYGKNNAVVYRCGDFYLAEGELDADNFDVYVGVFKENTLLACEKAVVSDGVCMAFVYYPSVDSAISSKVFLWDQDLKPMCGVGIESSDANLIGSAISGTLSVESSGINIEFSAQTENGLDTYIEILDSENNVVFKEKKDKFINDTYTTMSSGTYTAVSYAVCDNGYIAEYAKKAVFVSPKNFGSDIMAFKPFKRFYIRNGNKVYYSKKNAENITVSNNEIYMTARQIKSIVGCDVGSAKKIDNSVKELYSLNDVCKAQGYIVEVCNNTLVFSDKQISDLSDYDEMFDEPILCDSFENQNYSSSRDNWYPSGWSFFDWNTGTHASKGFGKSEDTASDGSKSIYIDSPQNSFCGYIRSDVNLPVDAYSYEIDIDIKLDSSTANISPYVAIQLYKGSTFIKMFSMHRADSTPFDTEWRTARFTLTGTEVRDYDFDRINIVVCASKANSAGVSVGRAYYDNIRVMANSMTNDIAVADFSAANIGAMFTVSEPILYNVRNTEIQKYEYITAHVYDVDGNEVSSNTTSVFDVMNNGFSFANPGVGYYEAAFEGTCSDGTVYPLAAAYCVYSDSVKLYKVMRHSFAVFANDTKPMSQRNEMFMLSDSATDAETIELADKVGFSGIRIHTVNWGTNGGKKGFHTADGTFDWSITDNQINNVSKYGFKNVIANICNTPQWAAPSGLDSSRTNIVGNYEYNVYAPTNIRYLTDAVTAYANRYKDRITAIEFWNEPYYGKTAFWHDGADNFKKMSNAAYDAIKSASPDTKVYNSGFFVSASTFFDELMSDESYRKRIDGLSFHGRYSFYKNFGKVLDKYNMSDLEVMDSEGYFYSKEQRGSKDEATLNMYMVATYLNELKQGITKSAMFDIYDSYTGEYYDDMQDISYGLFRKVNSNYEPMRGVAVLRNIIDIFPNEISYVSEAKIDDQCAVVLSDGNSEYMVVWNSADKDFSLSKYFSSCITSKSTITDFYGRQANIDNLKSKTAYIITNVDVSGGHFDQNNSCLNNDFLYPHYTCSYGSNTGKSTARCGETGVQALFDVNTFELTGAPVVYTSRPVWISANSRSEYDAKFATAFTNDGLYVIADISGDSNWTTGESFDSIDECDSVIICADGYENNLSSEQNVFYISKIGGEDVIYKSHAAEIYAAQPIDFSPSGTKIKGGSVKIECSGNNLLYKIFIPKSELYPLSYTADKDSIKVSINAQNCNSSGYVGSMCFGDNIRMFDEIRRELPTLKLVGISVDTIISNGRLHISGDVFNGSKKIGAILYCNGKIANVCQSDSVDKHYSFDVPVSSGVKYDISICGDMGGIVSTTITSK